jgi:hypothetical protein
MSTKDPRIFLTSFLEEVRVTPQFKDFQWQIENNGCLLATSDLYTGKIYTPELAVLLTTSKLTGENLETNKQVHLNSQEYLHTFVKAFELGERYFEAEFKASPDVLYGANHHQYIKGLHDNYFHVKHPPSYVGWRFVKNQCPFILTHEAMKAFGYYSGVVSKVDELAERHPELFATFYECSNDIHSNQIEHENRETELRQKIEKHFGFFSGQCPRKHKTILNPEDYARLIDWTVSFYSSQFKVPSISKPISTVNTNKTYVQLAFRHLFKELHPQSTYPDSLFDFYRSAFTRFSSEKKENFFAVKHNDEVKELMQIDD